MCFGRVLLLLWRWLLFVLGAGAGAAACRAHSCVFQFADFRVRLFPTAIARQMCTPKSAAARISHTRTDTVRVVQFCYFIWRERDCWFADTRIPIAPNDSVTEPVSAAQCAL